jgi:Glyoxalase-like domain
MSTSATPRPLDHLVLPTADLGIARDRLSALGFTVAPMGIHPFGTENACVYLSDNTFLEPLVVGDAAKTEEAVAAKNVFVARDRQFRTRNGEEGLSAVVFGTEDADADHNTFVEAGVSAGDRLDFSRPFTDASGRADMASFRLAFAAEADASDAFFFTCERANVPQVDRSALQAHANGARRIASIIACVDDPASHARFFEAVANVSSQPVANGRMQVSLPNAAIELVDPATFEADIGAEAPAGNLRLSAIVFGVASLTQTEKFLRANVIEFDHRGSRLIVPSAPGQGAIFVFEEL